MVFGLKVKSNKFQVKNKLDGNIYAIKAIRLSMNNKQMDKKMVREVKLLSKLNHENVVRYYTSWIETDSTALGGSSDTELVFTCIHIFNFRILCYDIFQLINLPFVEKIYFSD